MAATGAKRRARGAYSDPASGVLSPILYYAVLYCTILSHILLYTIYYTSLLCHAILPELPGTVESGRSSASARRTERLRASSEALCRRS